MAAITATSSATPCSSTSRSSVIRKIETIQHLCAQPNNPAEPSTTLITARLDALLQVLDSITSTVLQEDEKKEVEILQPLWNGLLALETTIENLFLMNRLVYVVKALQVQEDIERCLDAISSSLRSLLSSAASDNRIQAQLRSPLNKYYTLCENQSLRFNALKNLKEMERIHLIKNQKEEEEDNAIISLIGDLSTESISESLRSFRQDLHILTGDLESHESLSENPKARGEALHYQYYLKTIVQCLKIYQQQQQQQSQRIIKSDGAGSGAFLVHDGDNGIDRDDTAHNTIFPAWALDPITKRVMTHPVTIRAPCAHNMDKSTFSVWMKEGKKGCPICQTPLKGISAKNNKDLETAIRSLSSSSPCQELTLADLNNKVQKVKNQQVDFGDSWASLSDMILPADDDDGEGDEGINLLGGYGSRSSHRSHGNSTDSQGVFASMPPNDLNGVTTISSGDNPSIMKRVARSQRNSTTPTRGQRQPNHVMNSAPSFQRCATTPEQGGGGDVNHRLVNGTPVRRTFSASARPSPSPAAKAIAAAAVAAARRNNNEAEHKMRTPIRRTFPASARPSPSPAAQAIVAAAAAAARRNDNGAEYKMRIKFLGSTSSSPYKHINGNRSNPSTPQQQLSHPRVQRRSIGTLPMNRPTEQQLPVIKTSPRAGGLKVRKHVSRLLKAVKPKPGSGVPTLKQSR